MKWIHVVWTCNIFNLENFCAAQSKYCSYALGGEICADNQYSSFNFELEFRFLFVVLQSRPCALRFEPTAGDTAMQSSDCASHHWPGCCWLLGLQRWRSVLLILKNQYAVNIIKTNTGHDTAWQLQISVRMTGTEGGVDVLVLMSSSSSVTLLSMKSTCSAFPFTVKSTMVFNTSHSTNNDLWPVPLSSPLLDSSSSSARLLWSLLTSAMRRERSEKSSADWTHSTCQWNTDLFI